MLTYVCRKCHHVFLPKDESDFNATSGFRMSESGYFSVRNGKMADPKKTKCPKCGSTETEMSTAI